MKKYQFPIILHILLAFIAVSCQNDPAPLPQPEPDPEAPIQWEVFEEFSLLEKVIHGGFQTGNRILLYGPYMFNFINADTSVSRFGLSQNPGPECPPSTLFFPTYYNDGFFFTPIRNPVTSGTRTYINLPSIDSNFSYVLKPEFLSRRYIAINEQHAFLAAGKNARNNNIQFYHIQVDTLPGQTGSTDLTVGETKIIEITEPASLGSINTVHSVVGYKDYFLATLPGHTFKIYPDGTWREVIQTGVNQFFRHKDIIYAPKQFNLLYASSDEGESWFRYDNFPDIELARFYSVGDSLVYSFLDRLAVLNIETSGSNVTYRLREIENAGLEDNFVTTLLQWQGKVYAGTLSGLFTKPAEDFFKSKSEN